MQLFNYPRKICKSQSALGNILRICSRNRRNIVSVSQLTRATNRAADFPGVDFVWNKGQVEKRSLCLLVTQSAPILLFTQRANRLNEAVKTSQRKPHPEIHLLAYSSLTGGCEDQKGRRVPSTRYSTSHWAHNWDWKRTLTWGGVFCELCRNIGINW